MKDEGRTERLTVMVKKEELEAITRSAYASGMNRSEFVRRAVLSSCIPEKRRERQ